MEGRNSFIFYRSFYESIREFPKENRADVYDAICALALDGEEIGLEGIAKAIFILIKPQIEANNKRYMSGKVQKKRKSTEKEERNTSEVEANDKRNGSETEAKRKQNGSEVEANEECRMKNVECRMKNEKMYAKSDERSTPIASIILKDGTVYHVEEHQAQMWKELFPDVNVEIELKKMQAWSDANPGKRKTARGVKAFIVNWLSREQKGAVQKSEAPKLPDWYSETVDSTAQDVSDEEIRELQRRLNA